MRPLLWPFFFSGSRESLCRILGLMILCSCSIPLESFRKYLRISRAPIYICQLLHNNWLTCNCLINKKVKDRDIIRTMYDNVNPVIIQLIQEKRKKAKTMQKGRRGIRPPILSLHHRLYPTQIVLGVCFSHLPIIQHPNHIVSQFF